MLSCRKVCYLVSESMDGRLPWRERFGVRLHLVVCSACQRIARQMQVLRAAGIRLQSSGKEKISLERETLSTAARDHILSRLRQAGNHPARHEQPEE